MPDYKHQFEVGQEFWRLNLTSHQITQVVVTRIRSQYVVSKANWHLTMLSRAGKSAQVFISPTTKTCLFFTFQEAKAEALDRLGARAAQLEEQIDTIQGRVAKIMTKQMDIEGLGWVESPGWAATLEL